MLSATAAQAGRILSPSEYLRDPLTETMEASLQAVEGNKLVFQPVGNDAGDSDPIALRMPDFLLPRVSVGERYLVAFVRWARAPSNPEAKVAMANGPTVAIHPGLEPALLLASARNVEIWELLRSADRDRADYAEQLEDLLQHPDPQVAIIAAAEWINLSELRAGITPAVAAKIGKLAASGDVPAYQRAFLLNAAVQLGTTLGQWWQPLSESLLSESSVYGLSSYGEDSLLMAAMNAANQLALPAATLERWVSSENSALAEAALLNLRRNAPQREQAAIQAALEQSLLPAQTREFLNDHLRRLQLAQVQGDNQPMSSH